MTLTPRQVDVLDFIARYRAEHRRSPSQGEIARHLGVTRHTINEHVYQLEKKGVISREKGRWCSIEILPAAPVVTT